MLKNIKSLFVVSDEEQNNAKAEPSSNPQTSSPASTAAPQASTIPSAGKVDNVILDKLVKALEDNNQPGFDYFEFRKALLTLNALQMNEATKFQSTFATAATMGISLENLLQSIEFYKKVMKNEEENFTKAIKEQTAVKIGNNATHKEKLEATIVEKSKTIQKLTDEIRQHQSEIQELTKTIELAEQKIDETSLNFQTTLKVIYDQLEQDSVKLKQYIK